MFFVGFCLTIISLCSIVNGRLSSPFDIRLDNYKIDTTRDLVIHTPRPKFSWKIPFSNDISQRNIYQNSYQIQLESIQLTNKDKQLQWDSQMKTSSQSIHVPYEGHIDLLPSRYYRFRIRVWTSDSNDASQWTNWIQFRTSIFNLNEYLTRNDDLVWIGSTKINMNELRKEFTVPNTSPIKSALIYICGLGYYELYLNGQNVDPTRKLDPGWTTYEKRSLLASFDVTQNITAGPNAVGVKLGNGWYSHEQHGEAAYGPPRLLFTLTITFQSGDEMQVVSDQTWTGREGSVKHDSVYNGEIYDSRADRPGWSQVGFNDSLSAWITPEILPSPVNKTAGGLLTNQDMPPIRAGNDALHFEVSKSEHPRSFLTQKDIGQMQGASLTNGSVLKPISIWSSESGVHTFDLGQNMAGWCQIKFTGPSGYGTYIRHAESLVQPTVAVNHATRNIYTENLREATASDTYILRGDPNGEYYEPSFTYHGFRYVSVFGPPSSITADDVQCPFVHSETTVIGKFSSSNPIINQIQQNIQWGQLSNSMSLPTDCPQRNERRGWMGDAALTVNEALYNFDFAKFYENFLNLIGDVQLDDGQVPDFVPGNGYQPDPNWGTALPTIAWQLYKHTTNVEYLDTYYNSVRAYVEYLRAGYNQTGLVNFYCRYGDWVPPPPNPQTNRHLISSFAFLHDVDILLNMSIILEKSADVQMYTQLYNQLTEEFHRVFFNSTGNYYADGLQAAQVLALALRGVVPSNLQNTVVEYLVTDINKNGNHVTTGIVSNAQLYPVLSNNGHHDLAVQLVTSTTYPSYGYMFNNPYENATTIWELWDTPSEGPGMNSRNHHMYASVGAWFYSHLAGIEFFADRINIRPRMLTEQNKHLMNKLDCQLSTLNGLIHLSYTRHQQDTDSNSILIRLTIPPNTKSTLQLEPLFPGAKCSKLIENKQVIWSDDSTYTNQNDFFIVKDYQTGLMNIHLGSGQYEFQALWK